MRYLTIKREKSFVGCISTMKVYIEDPISGTTKINGVRCSKLGDLKNGEENVFLIPETEAKLFVIADRMSKNIYNEFYQIPAGVENIFLSGKNKYNPIAGNPFRFNGVTDEAVLKNRKKVNKRGLIVLIVAAVIGFFIGLIPSLTGGTGEPEVFYNDGIEITLTDEFSETHFDGFDNAYISDDVAVVIYEESFADIESEGIYSVDDYAKAFVDANGLIGVEPKKIDRMLCMEYSATISDETYVYNAFVYETEDSYLVVQFYTLQEMSAEYKDSILEWAKTVNY